MGNFRETFGNFLETVRVVIGQESVRVGMWSQLNHAKTKIKQHCTYILRSPPGSNNQFQNYKTMYNLSFSRKKPMAKKK